MLWKVSLVFQDRDGNSRRLILHTSAATDVAALVAFAQGLEAAVSPLSNANIVSASISYSWRSSRPLPSLFDFSDVKRKALLLSRLTDDSAYASVLVPSPVAAGPGSASGDTLGAWRTPLQATARRGIDTPRVFVRLRTNPAPRAAIDALLAVIVRADGSAFPAQDWLYAELSP